MHTDAARALYNKITSLEGFERDLQIDPDVADRDDLIDKIGDALLDCRSDDGRLHHAPSPWHAYFFLLERLARARGRDSTAFFRGHNVVGLPCVAARLYREDMTEELSRRARLAVEILTLMFEKSEILRMKEDDPKVLARTVAQHYGIKTSLIDVTLDPSVAVFFALTGGCNDAGAVFVFDWQHCHVMGLPVVLPPMSPWARRLTIQRGFFLDFEQIKSLDVHDIPFEIQFPRMPGFEVRRAGNVYVPWPVEEPAASELISWVETAAENNEAISPSITAEIEARGKTRVLLRQQFELMFGFAPDASLPQPEIREQMMKAVWQYMIDSFTELETYINHLCLQRGFLAAERLSYLQESNRSVFNLYADQLCRARRAGLFLEPPYTELLRILKHECP